MGSTLRNKTWFRHTARVCRVLFALTFIFSGTVKVVDPWGTALNLNNYLAGYGLMSLSWISLPFSIWMCGAELMMGLMLLCKVRIRLISIFALCTMIFFTVLTLLSATVIPIEDCGCFGLAVKLTPWQTFFKNLILLPMAAVIWYRYLPDRIFAFNRTEVILTVVFCTFSMGLGIYCYRHLPLFDFLPYGEGVNISEAMAKAREESAEDEVVLVYRNRRTGKLREFGLKDRAWQNEKKWEWVETRVDEESTVEPTILEFYVSDSEGKDVTDSLLHIPGRLHMICVVDFEKMGDSCERRLGRLADRARAMGENVVCLTSDPEKWSSAVEFDGCAPVEKYNMDAKTLKTLLRARAGVVELNNGTIVLKRNCRDVKDF